MKRITSILICVLLLAAMMILPVSAEGSPAAAFGPSVATGAPGTTVTVTLNLSGFPVSSSLGVKLTSISDGLKFSSAQWLLSGGLMSSFDAAGQGVWTSGDETDINANVATFTFVVPTPAAGQTNMDYSFRCKVEARHNTEIVGTATAYGTIRVSNPATGLTLDKSSLALDLNGNASAALQATVTPANTSDTVVWSSSDSSVASVSNGQITAHKAGSATITATAGSQSASCAVTVTCSHNLTTHSYKAPTCQATGNNLYYTCSACGVVLDAKNAVTTVEAQTLAKVGHSGGTATCAAKANCTMCGQPYGETLDHTFATAWSSDASGHWKICTSCNTAKSSAAEHTLVWITDKYPTEDATGLKHQECTCGYKINKDTEIDKLPHTHVGITHHKAEAATCTATGNVEYWTCSSPKCDGKYYGDENCSVELPTITTPINDKNHGDTEVRGAYAESCYKAGYTGDTCCKDCGDVLVKGSVIPATQNHVAGDTWQTDGNLHWHICTTSGCGSAVDRQAHTFKWVVDQEATEDDTGLKHEECACGYKRNVGITIPKLDHVHVGIQHHNAVPATCVQAGTVEYWTCSSNKCANKYYGDENCQLLLTTKVDPINANNHVGATELKNKEDPTCSEGGYSGDLWCTSCKKMIKEGSDLGPTGKHTPKKEYGKDEKYHWQICSECDCVINNAQVEHTFTWVFDKKPTEQATGIKHQECTACGYKTSENTVADKLKHTPVWMEGKLPTCEEDGILEHYYCENCNGYYSVENGKWIKKEALVLKATGHDIGTEWLSDENNHWHGCACGETADKAAHECELTGAVEATQNEAGYTGDEVCTVCGYVKTVGQSIPSLAEQEAAASAQEQETEAPEETEPQQSQQPQQVKRGFPIIWVLLMVVVAVVIVLLIVKLRKGRE